MIIDKQKIYNILRKIPFRFEDLLDARWVEDNITWIDTIENCNVNYGVSKFVIVPQKENFVIKIPIPGFFDARNNYEDFSHAKSPLCNEITNDYCRVEQEYYILAQKEKLDFIFAETIFFCDYLGYQIYLQEKCRRINDTPDFLITVEEEEKIKRNKLFKIIDPANYDEKSLLTYLTRYYSDSTCIKLFDFIHKNKINDLSDENIGFSTIDNRFVLIDYSGYNG